MGIVAIGVTYWGGWPFKIVWIVATFFVALEWRAMVNPDPLADQGDFVRLRRFARETSLFGVGTALTYFASALDTRNRAFVPIVAAAVALAFVGASAGRRLWSAGGIFYALALGIAVMLCRSDAYDGMIVIFWLFAVVWGTDIIAYFTGRSLGGPKLWPRVSPKKTWSGAIGGLVGGAALGCALLLAFGQALRWQHVALSIAFSILTQAGDLFESALKRRFGVKDSGHLIPGHGGFMDRLDGFVFAVAFAAAFGAWRNGVAGVPQGLLAWP